MVKAKKYVVVNTFQGTPKREDFKIVEEELPPLKDGQILVKTEWISVDPYIRLYPALQKTPVPFDQTGFQVGIVEQSKHPKYSVGDRVVNHKGWRTYTIINPDAKPIAPNDKVYKVPDLLGLSPSLAVGSLGMPGVTAHFGLLEVIKPKAGDTLVVTGAAGAVGSLVGQIGKIKGCKVIGFAGSDDKVEWLEKELGFDKAFNYKTVDTNKALKEAAPNGVDCFYDNVGGELSSIIVGHMNTFGRIGVCGSISVYNDDVTQLPKTTTWQPMILFKQLKIEGFHCYRWDQTQWIEAIKVLAKWIKSDQLKAREHVTEGFDKIYDAFIGMMKGDNFGKAIVKV